MAAFKEDSSSKVVMSDAQTRPSTRSYSKAINCHRRVRPHSRTPSNQAIAYPAKNDFLSNNPNICTAGIETAGRPLRGGDAGTG